MTAFDRRLLVPMIAGAVLNPVNSSIIAVALVPIGTELGAPPSQTAWLVSALYLATAVGQPVTGRLIDLYGPRVPYLAATALVGVAGIVGMLAPNLAVLVIARVILGIGTCAGYPAAMRLIRGEAERTGQSSPAGILTVLAVSTQSIFVIGPPLGGFLIGAAGWRATLGINIPLALVAIAAGLKWLPRTPRAERPAANGGIDILGMVLFGVTLIALLVYVMEIEQAHWYLLGIVAVAAAGFAFRELRIRSPFIDLRLLGGNLPLLLTYARAFLSYIVTYSFLYGYTQWLEGGRGLSPSATGLIQLPVFATAMLVSILTGRSPRIRGKLAVAGIGQVLVCALMLLLHPTSAIVFLVALSIIFGIPQGLNGLALQNSIYFQADEERIAASAGLLRTFGYLGAVAAAALQGATFGPSADTVGMHRLTIILLICSSCALAITLADRSLARVGANELNS